MNASEGSFSSFSSNKNRFYKEYEKYNFDFVKNRTNSLMVEHTIDNCKIIVRFYVGSISLTGFVYYLENIDTEELY